ncbi:hypothetical protein ACFYYR_13705 [Streptomyces sp. NPDC001922]|uniref:hypothetical protein n=1 Tax=Streptomyces sp. NPDC001922 TaxID=3364624 RepID=UPI0036C92D3E
MATLTSAQRARLESMLDQLSRSKLEQVLANVDAFLRWLRDAARSLWESLKNTIGSIWDSIVDWFRY